MNRPSLWAWADKVGIKTDRPTCPQAEDEHTLRWVGCTAERCAGGAAFVAQGLCCQQFGAWRLLHSQCPASSPCSGQQVGVTQRWACECCWGLDMGAMSCGGHFFPVAVYIARATPNLSVVLNLRAIYPWQKRNIFLRKCYMVVSPKICI